MGGWMNVPIIDLKAQYDALRQEIDKELREVIESQQFILGEKVERLEREVASLCGARFAIGCASGTDAMMLSLRALGIGAGDEVITAAFSFFSSAGAIWNCGARPVFADIELNTYNIDAEKLSGTIKQNYEREKSGAVRNKETGGRLKALLPVHLYGQSADMDPILVIAEEYGLAIVEDAAQSICAKYFSKASGGKYMNVGTMGTTGCVSFFPTKNLGGFGDGGMIFTRDEQLAEMMRMLRVHGSEQQLRYFHKYVGWNSRLDAVQAAVLLAKLPHLERWCIARREHAHYYNRALKGSGLVEDGRVTVPFERDTAPLTHIYNQYVIRCERRDDLKRFLAAKDIQTAIYYPLALHEQECFRPLGYKRGDFPNAERAAEQVLALPVHPELTRAQKDYVVENIKAFYRA
jgi:dTDP-4-amino-4,6-dideoxygalactose transaminase